MIPQIWVLAYQSLRTVVESGTQDCRHLWPHLCQNCVCRMLHNQFAINHAPEKLERVAIAADWMDDNQVLLGCIERDSVDPAPFVHGFLAFPHGFEDSVIVCTLIETLEYIQVISKSCWFATR